MVQDDCNGLCIINLLAIAIVSLKNCYMKRKFFLLRNVCIILLLLLTAQLSFSQNNFKVTGKVTMKPGNQYREQRYR